MVRTFKHIRNFIFCALFIANLAFQKKATAIPIPQYIQVEIDSLLKVLPFSDATQRIDVLLALSKHYLSFSMDSSREYARLALVDAKKIGNKPALAEIYKLLGNISYYQGNNNTVIQFYDSSAIVYALMGDSLGLSKVWNNLGIINQNIGNYEKSIDYHYKSLECKIKLKDSIGIANSYNNIGSIYFDIEEYAKSQEYFLKAFEISEKMGNQVSVQSNLNNLGMISQEIGEIEKSLEYFEKSLEAAEITNYQQGIANTYHNIGKSKFLLSQYNEALEYYFKSVDLNKSLGISNSQTLNNIGQIYIELDYYRQALRYLNQAYEIAIENNQFKYLRDIYRNLSVAYERLNQFDKAYENYLKYNFYDDSIKNQIYSSRLEKINNKYEIEKKKEEIEKLNLENELLLQKKDSEIRRRNFTIYSVMAGFIAVLIITIILFRLFRQKAKSNGLLQQQNEEILRSDKTIKKINKALTENEEMLRSVFDASPYSILVTDSETTIIDCNNASLNMFNAKNKREILKKRIEDIIVSDECSDAIENLNNIQTSEPIKSLDCLLRKNDGTDFYAEINKAIIRDSARKVKAQLLIITDITERQNFIRGTREEQKLKQRSPTD